MCRVWGELTELTAPWSQRTEPEACVPLCARSAPQETRGGRFRGLQPSTVGLLSSAGREPEQCRALSSQRAQSCAPPSAWAWDQVLAPLALVCSPVKWGHRLCPGPRVFEGGA